MQSDDTPSDVPASDAPGLRERVRFGQTDLDDAIALLRTLTLDEIAPAATFDPKWREAAS